MQEQIRVSSLPSLHDFLDKYGQKGGNMKSKQMNEMIEKVTEKITLRVFEAGCDAINYALLNSLPLTTDELMKQFNLTKMPINRRINELVKVGLVNRPKRGGDIIKTELASNFLGTIDEIKLKVIKEIPAFI